MGARDLLAELADKGLTVTTDGERLVIRPASKLTESLRTELRTAKPDVLAIVARRTCADCAHRTRRKTCGEPVSAGLLPHFGIVFCELLPATQAALCQAFVCLDRLMISESVEG